jgi:hypothetical protein
MHAWRGWAAALAPGVNTACSWEDWRANQQRLLGDEQRQQDYPLDRTPFSRPELARLAFVRWLSQTGRLDPRAHDNH